MNRLRRIAVILALGPSLSLSAQMAKQPKVAPGPDEPDWDVILRDRYGLSMYKDLLNPVKTDPVAVPGLFRRAGQRPVRFTPVIALGLVTRNRGGWYRIPAHAEARPEKFPLWSYLYRNSAEDVKTGSHLPPPLDPGSTTSFDPGPSPFGLWVSNDGLDDGGVYSQPGVVRSMNRRLSKQPYKAMIYPNRDRVTGKSVPHSFLIGWEYSTNDDFQDVVCQVDNVELIPDEQSAKPDGSR